MIDWLIAHSSYLLLLVIFAAIKQEIKKGFTGRVSLMANTASIFTVAGPIWANLPWYLQLWALFGIPIGIIAFLTYMTDTSLPSEFYFITWLVYNSVFAFGFIVLFG